MKYIFIMSLSSIIFIGCPVYDAPMDIIDIQNYSPNTIYIYETCLNQIDSLPIRSLYLLDTTDGVEKISSPPYRIPAYEFKSIISRNWKSKINNCPDSALKVFVISEQTMKTKSWEEIWKNQLYIQRAEFKYEEVIKNYGIIRILGKNNIH